MTCLARWAAGVTIVAVLAYLGVCIALDMAEPDVVFVDIPTQPLPSQLPDGFLWGTATSAHQVEGGNVANDWARFEAEPGRTASGVAADHWNKVAEDITLMRDIGANAYRFSVEWSRVEPSEGVWDDAAWAHYQSEVAQLRAAGIEPMATLLHFTLPAWLAERGGLTALDFPSLFGNFAVESARRLGADVDIWCTLNEPNVQMYQGYVEGIWPPGERNTASAAEAFAGLVRGHAAASLALREFDPGSQIGVAMSLIVFDPASRWSLLDWIAAKQAEGGFNWAFYDSIKEGRIQLGLVGFPKLDDPLPELKGSADFLGINYYRRNMVDFSWGAPGLVSILPGPGRLSDTGVEVYPEGLLRLMRQAWKSYGLPIYVTENGVADSAGVIRPDFIRSHAHAIGLALSEGIPVQGYFHWSLLDNFEWTAGFGPRFGLYHVDRTTMERRPAAGAAEFARLAPHKQPSQ